jgi:transcriptional regulator with XRE-family HTH domain
VVGEAVELIAEAASTFERAHVPPALTRQLAQWVRASGSLGVAQSLHNARARLGGISLRESARRSGIAAGHLSELEDGRGSLPTVATAQRLDAALNTDLVGFVASVRKALPTPPTRRPRLTAGHMTFAPAGSLDPRLDSLFSRIAGDDRLVQINEDLLSLSAGTRRGIAQMIRALAADVSEGRR